MPATSSPALRVATREDIPAIEALIRRSVHGLMAEHLTPAQMEVALGAVLGVDAQLIDDRTYFVVEDGSELLGAGGWSRRTTLILDRSEHEARAAGFKRLELMATPTGIVLYERRGYATVEPRPIELPDGSSIAGRVMRKAL